MIRIVDGPYTPPLQGAECSECNCVRLCDMYVHFGRVICGECRYEKRTGKKAPRRATTGSPSTMTGFDEETYALERVGILHSFNAVSKKHCDFINDWLNECQLSLD